MDANTEKFPEVGGIVHLDHVNFVAPDQDLATAFFMNGLGFTRDPYQRADETNMGVNVGMEQFHLPRRGTETPPFYGEIGIVVPRIDVIRVRLERLERLGRFEGTRYGFEEQERQAVIRAPDGYLLRLHEAGTLEFQRPLGIAYVEVAVPPGTSAAIGRFYREIFRAPVDEAPVGGEPTVTVSAGPFQSWRFVERDLPSHDTASMHVSFYTTNYTEIRRRLVDAGVAEPGGRDHVYFFKRIFDPRTGETVFSVNNEVRSLYHPDFRRPLANRWPIVWQPFSDQADIEAEIEAKLGCVPSN